MHASDARQPDDRILPITRAAGTLVAISVFTGFALLWVLPGQTRLLWSFTMEPTLTPMMLGSAYLAGTWFFWCVARPGQRWHTVTLGFPSVTVFAWTMMATTVVHWDVFNRAHLTFIAWVLLYAVTPLLVPALWWMNRRHDPGREPGETMLPVGARVLIGAGGLTTAILAVVWYLEPARMMAVWPWMLTPMTARTIVAWISLASTFGIAAAVDGRWSAVRLPMLTALIGSGVMVVSMARAWPELDPANPLRVAFLAAFVLAFPAILGLAAILDARPARTDRQMDHQLAR